MHVTDIVLLYGCFLILQNFPVPYILQCHAEDLNKNPCYRFFSENVESPIILTRQLHFSLPVLQLCVSLVPLYKSILLSLFIPQANHTCPSDIDPFSSMHPYNHQNAYLVIYLILFIKIMTLQGASQS